MKAVVFGSLNIDKVYSLSALPEKGETVTTDLYEVHVGGKGLNQAVSLSKAGAQVKMAGRVGYDGDMLLDFLQCSGVDTSLVKKDDKSTGHCIIEVDNNGQNQMILYPGANRRIDEGYCDEVLAQINEGDLLLMQYETTCVEYMAKEGKKRGAKIALNPSPFVPALKSFPYEYIDYLILNEFEGQELTGKKNADEIINSLRLKMPCSSIILTLGGNGAIYADMSGCFSVPAAKVKAIDTTGAGDTFTGYFFELLSETGDPAYAMKNATIASSIAVRQIGAAQTIPSREQVNLAMNENND